jgi:hypothetical protein
MKATPKMVMMIMMGLEYTVGLSVEEGIKKREEEERREWWG